MQDTFTTTLNVKTSTPGNNRKHWRLAGREAKTQRTFAMLSLKTAQPEPPPFPVKVTLTRLSTRRMDRHNLSGAMKHIIDGIADFYGVDDGDDGWQFEFGQECAKIMGVRIEIEAGVTNGR